MTKRTMGMKWLAVVLILATVVGCGNKETKEHDLLHVKSKQGADKKKVIFLMIDTLMAQSIDEGIRQKQLPTFQYLIGKGHYHKDMVSSFPTMSVTIDSSMLTGAYPHEHRVPGLLWYSAEERRLINYGTGPMEILRQGVNHVLEDALINLNGRHLNPKIHTIYEDLARLGLTSGSINGLVYRGKAEHTLSIPAWIEVPTTLHRNIKVKGPDLLTLGALSNPLNGKKNMPDSIANRLGMDNKFAMEALEYLIREKKLPDFLYVYLPDLDQKIHKNGPSDLEGIRKLDGQLQSMLQAFGSPEKALEEAIIVIAGDSGMTQLLPADQHSEIDLPAILNGYRILRPGERPTDETDVILAVNETMAYIYNPNGKHSMQEIAGRLLKDNRIDMAAWKDEGWIHVLRGSAGKQLKYHADGSFMDTYGQKWTIEGDKDALDLKAGRGNPDEGQPISYGEYPDVLQRLASALHSHTGSYMVVTSKPGYELKDRSSPTHEGGGGHGSIGKKESLVPLIICGTDREPRYLRMIDLKAFLLDLLAEPSQNGKPRTMDRKTAR